MVRTLKSIDNCFDKYIDLQEKRHELSSVSLLYTILSSVMHSITIKYFKPIAIRLPHLASQLE